MSIVTVRKDVGFIVLKSTFRHLTFKGNGEEQWEVLCVQDMPAVDMVRALR